MHVCVCVCGADKKHHRGEHVTSNISTHRVRKIGRDNTVRGNTSTLPSPAPPHLHFLQACAHTGGEADTLLRIRPTSEECLRVSGGVDFSSKGDRETPVHVRHHIGLPPPPLITSTGKGEGAAAEVALIHWCQGLRTSTKHEEDETTHAQAHGNNNSDDGSVFNHQRSACHHHTQQSPLVRVA